MIWQTFGHKQVKNILEKQLQTKVFSHAYLFRGPEGLGKKTLALELAKKILQTQKLENHPDFILLDQQSEILAEQASAFISQMSFRPFLATHKVAIINNAELLNSQSSNALLKTLEEPAKNTIIILIANSFKLLRTIVSRCQVLNFNSFSPKQIEEYCQSKNFYFTEELTLVSFGRPGRLSRLVLDPGYKEQENLKIAQYQQFLQSNLGDRLVKLPELAEEENLMLEEKLTTWMFWQEQQLTAEPKNFKRISGLIQAMDGLKNNLNKKLVLQKLATSV